MKRLLIIGGTGFVGSNLARFLSARYEIVIASRHAPATSAFPWVRIDITERRTVGEVIAAVTPDAVVHAAGIKDVRFCQRHPLYTFRVNGRGTANIAAACRDRGILLVYLSTDLVFPSVHGWYRETDIPCSPLVYGQSKYLGEALASRATAHLAICRSAGVYGADSPLLTWLADALSAGNPVDCFTDVHNTPTYAGNLAEMIAVVVDGNLTGIFHTVGSARVDRYEFFRTFAERFGLDASRLLPVAAGERLGELLLMPDSSLRAFITSETLGVRGVTPEEGFLLLKNEGGFRR